ncbi:peptide MFS transporter [uncultured Massilia sp.]|uniref:peptide MFS transporter n=1 Tax=uncultured Massilia sp. TaxID=169973 RepID=UPI0025F98AC8|nr:peptide MFS transporter [uncultured Massilia sp.]
MRDQGTWFGQPRGLTILFLTETWEKFSFFGMRALQIYYMTKGLNLTQATASYIFGAYAAGVYLTPIFGGLLADRWLGRKRAVVIGGLLMAVGHFMMAFEPLFFVAMAVIAVGNGLFLPNLPSQVPLLYPKGDRRIDSAFNVYYVGVNLGGFLAPLVCGTLGELYGWHYGFGAAGIGMCLGLAIYVWGGRYLPADAPARPARAAAGPAQAGDGAGHVALLLGVAFAVVLFRTAYEQTGNTLALWMDTRVDRLAFGMAIPATWFQALNPMFVFLISPVLVHAWNVRARRAGTVAGEGAGIASSLRRMAAGAAGMGACYGALALLIALGAGGAVPVHWLWLVGFFAVFTLAELHILPVGLGLFARLAPARFGATTIAAWFLCSFAGNLLAGIVGAAWERTTPQAFFLAMAAVGGVAGLLLLGIEVLYRTRRAAALRHAAAVAHDGALRESTDP